MDKQNSGDLQTPFFNLVLQDNPLAEPKEHSVPAGCSVQDIWDSIPETGGSKPQLLVNGESCDPDYIIKQGDLVNVTCVPAGSGLEWYWVVAIMVGSAALSYALMPDIGNNVEGVDENAFNRISGLSNKTPIYEPYQAVLGKRKVAPVYIARPYTSIEGDREYFHGLFSVGYGPLKLENLRIGETLIEDFDDVEVVVLDHYENTDESVIRQFWQQDINQTNIQIELREEEGWTNRTTEASPQTVVSNFLYPSGVFRTDSKGNQKSAEVQVRQDLQAEDGTWWTPILYRSPLTTFYTVRGTVTEVNGQMRLWTTDGERVDLNNSSDVSANSKAFNYNQLDIRTGNTNDETNLILFQSVPESELCTSHRHANSSSAPRLRSLRIPVQDSLWPSNNAINIRTRKEYPSQQESEDNNITGSVTWENLQTIRPLSDEGFQKAIGYDRPELYIDGTSARTFRPTVIGIRMRATGQLNGNLDNFFVDATMVVPSDKTADWRDWPSQTLTTSNNPADAYKWLMQGPMNYSPIPNTKIDNTVLTEWRNRCTTEGWSISALVDYESTLFAELQKVSYLGRAEFSFKEGKFGVVEKIERTVPRQMFTPFNSANFQSKRVYPEPVDGVKFTFESAAVDYEQDEGVFLDPIKDPLNNGGDTSKLRGRYTTNELWGVDNFDQAYRLSRFDYYEKFLQRELYTLDVDIEALASNRGDLVRVQNDIINVGYGAGRITAINGTVITLAETIGTENITTQQIGVQVRSSQGIIFSSQADYLGNGQWDCDSLDPTVQVGDLVVYGEYGLETIDCIITSIVYNDQMGATLTLLNAANEMYSYDGNPIPTYTPNITLPVDYTQPPTPVISANASQGKISVIVANPSTLLKGGYRVFIQARKFPTDRTAEDYFNGNDGWYYIAQGDQSQNSFIVEGQERGFNYQVRAQYRSESNMLSAWSNTEEFELPLALNIPAVTGLSFAHLNDGTYLVYNTVDHPEFDSYEIRTDTNFGVRDAAYVGTTKDNQFFLGILSTGDTYYVAAKNIYSAYGISDTTIVTQNVPQDPINFSAINEGFGSRLTWEKTDLGYQLDSFEIRFTESGVGDVFGSSVYLANIDALTLTHSTSQRGVYWYYIRAVDIAGNTSNWVSTSVDVQLTSTYITDQLATVNVIIDDINTDLTEISHDIRTIGDRAEDSELEILQSLTQQSASREELRNRIANDELLIDAAVYIDPATGTIINRAFQYSDDLFTQAQLTIDGVDARVTANVEAISLVEGEVENLAAELQLVPGQITATATSIVADAIQALEPAHSFNFFDSSQGWSAVTGTLSAATPYQIDLTLGNIENTSLDFLADDNTTIRLTIERTGGTGWVGDVEITRDNATTETFTGVINDIPSGGEIVRTIDFRPIAGWSGTINEVRLHLGATVADTFTVKAIVIGKPDAALLELEDVTARVTQAELDISAVDGRVDTVVSDLQTFEDDTADNFTLVEESIDATNSRITNRVFEIVGNRRDFEEDALQQLLNEIDTANYRIADIDKTINFADAINILNVEVSEEGALAQAITALEATTVTQGNAIQANTESLQQVETDVAGNASALSRIASGVTGESNEATALLQLDAYFGEGGLGARAFLGTDVNGVITGVVVNDDGVNRQIEFAADSVVFVDGSNTPKIFYSLADGRYVFDGEIQASAGSFTGNIEATSGDIAGWEIQTGLLRSAASGQRIQLDSNNSRISVFDAVNEKVAMGYLEGLPKTDGSGNWSSNDYGFWARAGDNLTIDGGVDYTSGDFAVQNDASVSIYDSSANEIVRLGTDNGSKGLFVYDTSGTRIVELSSGGMLIGNLSGQYIRWTSGGGLDVSGDIESSGGSIGGWDITTNTLTSGNITLNSALDTISIGTGITIAPNDFSIGTGFSWDSSNGLVVDSAANIAGWIVQPSVFKSKNSGSRVELNATNNRVSIFDSVNEKVAMGYLNGLPKFDGSGNWTSNDYGFWARQGDTLVIDGSVDYNNGDFIVQNDASIKIRDGVTSNEILRVGTDTGEKGLFVYDASVSDGAPANQIAKFSAEGMYIGDGSEYISWTAADGLEVSGRITVGTQIGSETISQLQSRTTTAQTTANTANTNLTTLINNLGDVAYEDLIEVSKLGTTVIEGGYIKTDLLQSDVILSQSAVFDGSGQFTGNVTGTVDGEGVTTLRSRITTAQTTANTANTNLTTLTNNLGNVAYQDLLSQAYLKPELLFSLGNLTPNGSIPNGSLTDIVDYTSGVTAVSKVTVANMPSSYGLRFANDSAYHAARIIRNIPCSGGQSFLFKFWCSPQAGFNQEFQARIDWYDINGVSTTITKQFTNNNQGWRLFETTITLPSTAVSINNIYVARTSTNNTGGYGYITGIEVRPKVSGEAIIDGAIEQAKLGTTIIEGGYIKTDLLDVDTILGVNAVFSGELSAATGTFSGDLSAAGGMFTGTLSGVDGTFTGSLLAATGSFTGELDVNSRFVVSSTGNMTINLGTSVSGSTGSLQAGIDGFSVRSGSGVLKSSLETDGRLTINPDSFVGPQNRGAINVSAGDSRGVQSNGYDYAFYAASSGYGPFTGSHEGLIPVDLELQVGDIVVDVCSISSTSISNTLSEVTISALNADKAVAGVFVTKHEITDNTEVAGISAADLKTYSKTHALCVFNALGEGLINVCGRNGDIEKGDLITTSLLRGKGQRQDDDLVRNYTVAKARQSVTFDYPDQVKQIACFYMCG